MPSVFIFIVKINGAFGELNLPCRMPKRRRVIAAHRLAVALLHVHPAVRGESAPFEQATVRCRLYVSMTHFPLGTMTSDNAAAASGTALR
jgi:hypothetical protein